MKSSDIIMDFERSQRCGISEAVFSQYKTVTQLEKILSIAEQNQTSLLFTHLSYEKYNNLNNYWQKQIKYHEISQCAIFAKRESVNEKEQTHIAIVSAGSSDASVCEETLITLNYHGIKADLYQDIGVAGLWRLQQQLPNLQKYSIIIAIAGMEAALPTVLAGLIDTPIIAVPTSIGYGVATGGHVALNACLSSCTGGIMTMNIDNGYGAACAAIKIYKKIIKNVK